MQALTKFGVERSRFTVFLMLALVLIGLSAYQKLSKREDPSITIRTVVVSANFPGMSPLKMERLIAEPLERIARQVDQVEDITTQVLQGSVVMNLDIYESLPNQKLQLVFQDIRNKMANASQDLPTGTDGPYVNTNYGDVSIASVAVTGEGFSYAEIRSSARDLRKHLYQVKGVGKVDLLGVQQERIWLEFDPAKLGANGAYLQHVIADLQSQNIISSAGELTAMSTDIVLEVNGEFEDLSSIENMVTKLPGNEGFIRLGDIVNVRRGYVEPLETPAFFNGEKAVIVNVQMRSGGDIQVIGRALKKAVKEFEQTQAIGISYHFSTYQEEKVTVAINDALSNVLQTAAVVVLVLMTFLGLKPAWIVAAIVPFSVMFALSLMQNIGIELQIVSIAAVIISLGLLVDNGVVIVEDIQKQIARGEEPKQAAFASSKQFAVPLAIASITTVAAFLPLFLVDGTDGEYGFSLGAVVGLMLIGSWVSALYFLPSLCVWLLKKQPQNKQSTFSAAVFGGYRNLLTKWLPSSAFVVIAAYGVVMLAGTLFGQLKNEMFPMSSRAQYLIYMDMPKGNSIVDTQQMALKVERWLSDDAQNPEVKNTTTYVGDGGPRFYLALNPADTDPASAFILVNTFDYPGTVTASKRAGRYLLENFPEARFKIKQLSMGGGESGIVDIKITGKGIDKLMSLSEKVEGAFAKAPGIMQNENDWGNRRLKMVANIAQDKARNYGVTSQQVSNALNEYVSGVQISEYRQEENMVPIMFRAMEKDRDSLADLESITLSVAGKTIPLANLATMEPVFELSQLRRENQLRSIKISAKSHDLTAGELLAFVQPDLDALDLSGGYKLEIAGEVKDSAEVNEKLGAGMIPALLVMIGAIMFQFNSFRRVTIIFLTIPFIIIGSPVALLITGEPLSFFGTLGMISLAGIIINNAIVLIDQIDIERRTKALKEAIVEASVSRVSPIMLTTLTTVIGLVPMSLNGGPLFESMATLMIGGLLVASVISVFFVPSAYYLLFKDKA